MTDEAKKLLLDLLTACRAIESFAAGRSFAEYEKNEQFRAATERKFEIIGEALSRLHASDTHQMVAGSMAPLWSARAPSTAREGACAPHPN